MCDNLLQEQWKKNPLSLITDFKHAWLKLIFLPLNVTFDRVHMLPVMLSYYEILPNLFSSNLVFKRLNLINTKRNNTVDTLIPNTCIHQLLTMFYACFLLSIHNYLPLFLFLLCIKGSKLGMIWSPQDI